MKVGNQCRHQLIDFVGVGFFYSQIYYSEKIVKACVLCCAKLLQSCPTLWPHRLQPTGLLCPWDSLGRILEWVAMSSFRGSSQPRDPTTSLVSPALAGGFFTTGTTWEALKDPKGQGGAIKAVVIIGRASLCSPLLYPTVRELLFIPNCRPSSSLFS